MTHTTPEHDNHRQEPSERRERPPAGWYDPIPVRALTDEERAANTRQSYLAAERAAFTR